MKQTALFVVAIVVLATGAALASDLVAAERDVYVDQTPFWVDGQEYVNQAAFILSGRRCGTYQPDEATLEIVELTLNMVRENPSWFAPEAGVNCTKHPNHPQCQGGGGGGGGFTPVQVPVAFHVIHDGNQGYLSNGDINAQMNVLNNAYAGTGFSFAQPSVDYLDDYCMFEFTPDQDVRVQNSWLAYR